MAYALYRNYRPKRFSDLIGQDDVAETLCNQVAAGRIGHAYLFTGIRGTGKTTFARILAKAANCLNIQDGEPCLECANCVGIENGTIMDVTEIDAASNNGVDNIRDLRDETAYVPTVANHRVYIIDEVHMLSNNAFAALLKILEEPPEHVIFILATTEIHRVPATILSRCQRFDLKRISIQDISSYLLDLAKTIEIELQPDAALFIAQHADGAMRDALSILDTCISMGETVTTDTVRRLLGSSEGEYLFAISKAVAAGNIGELLKQIDTLYTDSLNPLTIARELLSHFRNILVTLVGGESLINSFDVEYVELYKTVAKLYTTERLIHILKMLKELAGMLPSVVDKRLQLEICMIEICTDFAVKASTLPQPSQKPAAPSNNASAAVQPKPEPPREVPAAKPPVQHKEPDKQQTDTEAVESSISIQAESAVTIESSKTEMSVREKRQATGDPEFDGWDKVMEEMEKTYPMLYCFMVGSRAYITDTHILIDCSDFAKEAIRQNKGHTESIKNLILSTTGVNLPIGPYSLPDSKNNEMDDEIEDLISRATSLGIPVEVK